MKCAMILVLLAVSLLVAAENVRERRNEVDLHIDANATRADIDAALKQADAIMRAAIKKVEDPNATVEKNTGEVQVPVRSADALENAVRVKPKRRGLIRVRIGFGKK